MGEPKLLMSALAKKALDKDLFDAWAALEDNELALPVALQIQQTRKLAHVAHAASKLEQTLREASKAKPPLIFGAVTNMAVVGGSGPESVGAAGAPISKEVARAEIERRAKGERSIELSRDFAASFAAVFGLATKNLLSFHVDVGPGEEYPMVAVTATYVVPKGAGEAAATLIRKFNLVSGPVAEQAGESVDRSTCLMTGYEKTHRPVSPQALGQSETTSPNPSTAPSRS